MACRSNKNLRDLLGCKNIVNNNLQKNSKNKIGSSTKCFSKSGNLCCKQVVHSSSFTCNITKKTYSIFYNHFYSIFLCYRTLQKCSCTFGQKYSKTTKRRCYEKDVMSLNCIPIIELIDFEISKLARNALYNE